MVAVVEVEVSGAPQVLPTLFRPERRICGGLQFTTGGNVWEEFSRMTEVEIPRVG